MNLKRRLLCESLEKRRLLAAAGEPYPSSEEPALVAAESEQLTAFHSAAADGAVTQRLTVGDIGRPEIYYGAPDLVQESGNRLFVVDQDPYSDAGARLFVFERLDDGSLDTASTSEIGFQVDRMLVVGNQVLLFGTDHDYLPRPLPPLGDPDTDPGDSQNPRALEIDPIFPEGPRTLVATINFGRDDTVPGEVARQEFDGILKHVHQDDERLVMILSSSEYQIAIYPPPLIQDRVVLTEITNDGLREVATIEIESGLTQVRGDTLVSAVTRYSEIHYFAPEIMVSADGTITDASGIRAPGGDVPYPYIEPMVVVKQYRLGAASIEEVPELELGNGHVYALNLADDGQSANVLRSQIDGTNARLTAIDLLDFSGGSVQLFETVLIPELYSDPLVSEADFVLLRDYDHPEALLLVNTDIGIAPATENRVQRIEIPASLNLLHTHVMLSDGQLVLLANRFVDVPFLDHTRNILIAPQSPETVLVNISLTDAAVRAITELEGTQALPPYALYLIDAESDRFGFLAMGTSAEGSLGANFNFGRLNGEGQYVSDGVIREIGFWREIDANPDRLIVRALNRIVEYDWNNPDEPVAVIPLVDPNAPPIEAVNDVYSVFTLEDRVLDVLANDHIPENYPPFVEIVELIDAPEGAEIHGPTIFMPAAAFNGVDSLRFEYVVSDGLNTSTAVVEIGVDVITEDEVRRLVEAVRRQAAEDFDVPVEEVEILVIERIFDQPLPVVLPGGGPELDLSPGILVTLNVQDATAFYAASLDGQIYQLFYSKREILAELGLRAVDDDGVRVEALTAGQEFWLEFIADDRREFGKGVYAAFYDLEVPADQIMLTDVVEYGPGFSQVASGELRDDGLTDFGAVGTGVVPPGGEPQQVFRIRAVAVAAGEVALRPMSADGVGTAVLLYGMNVELARSQIRYRPLQLTISDEPQGDPLDVDGNGEVTANDALRVINFLGTFGSVALGEPVADAPGEGEVVPATDTAEMGRHDANRDGKITALDALVIINDLAVQSRADRTAEAEKTVAPFTVIAVDSVLADDDEDEGLHLIF